MAGSTDRGLLLRYLPMALSLRGAWPLLVPCGWLLLAACSAEQPEDPVVQRAREWQAQHEQAAREQQAREDAQAAELQQAVFSIESDPPAILSEGQFYLELEYYCGACHIQPDDMTGRYPFAYFDDLEKLIDAGKVLPGDAEGSPLIVRMRGDHIPPEAELPAMPPIALALITDFIDRLPAQPDESAGDR